MKKIEQVRWGIIGAGDVCEIKSGPAFKNIENSELIAVMRRDADKAKDFARRHSIDKWYTDAGDLINDPSVNAIYIATPPYVHKDYTQMAALAGKPVYVEKPMALNHEESLEMISVCKKHNVPLFVAYYRRALPNFIKVKELIDNGSIGDIRYVKIKLNKTLEPDIIGAAGQSNNWRTDPSIAGGGYFFDLACHQLDILDFIFGPISEASGYSKNQAALYEAEDITVGSFHFESGIMGQGVWCFNCSVPSDEEITTIVGSQGEIRFSHFGDHSVLLKQQDRETQHFKFEISKNIQQALIQTIVDELRGKGRCPSTGASAARTARVMDQIYKRIDT